MTGVLKRRGTDTRDACAQRPRLHEDAGRRGPSTSLGEEPQEKSVLAPWPSSLQNCEKISISCVSCPVWGSLHRLTETVSLGRPSEDRKRWGGVSGAECGVPRTPQVFISRATEILVVRGDKCIEINTQVDIGAHFEKARGF